jgi:predicted nucleotidyltransferase
MMQPTTVAPRQRELIPLDPITPELLSEVVRRIVEAIDPDKIILFGSCARGTLHENSDIDLLVIKAGVKHKRRVASEIYGLFWDKTIEMDVLVTTPEDIAFALAHGNSFIKYDILEEGKVLYERSAASVS